MSHSSQTFKETEALLRQKMKDMLLQCTPGQRDVFRRMYNHKGTFDDDVDGVTWKQMDWAFKQLEQTLKDNALAASS